MKRRPRSLPVAEWPIADRTAWERALTPAKRLLRGGAASHLGQASIDDIEKRYGAYLGFLQRHGLFNPISAASQIVAKREELPRRAAKSREIDDGLQQHSQIAASGGAIVAEG